MDYFDTRYNSTMNKVDSDATSSGENVDNGPYLLSEHLNEF